MSAELTAALAAEQAAIYAYGLIGAHLDSPADRVQARAAEQAHRQWRDYLIGRIDAQGASAAPAPAGYQLPFPVTGRAAAVRLAAQVEDGVAQAWRPLLPVTAEADRTTALSALTEAAVRATRWRRRAPATPVTMPFPGRAG